MANPKAVRKNYHMPVPDGIDVKVVENADDVVHISLPATWTSQMMSRETPPGLVCHG